MKAIEKAAKVIVKQQKFVMYVWMFMSVITIASYFVIGNLWPDTDPFYPFLYGLPVVFMLSRSNKWETGFWSGFNHISLSPEDTIEMAIILGHKKLGYQILAVLIGILIAGNYVELISRFSLWVWPFLVQGVWVLGQAIGQESGFKKGWFVRPDEGDRAYTYK
jgi:hypothetical protein